MLVPSVSSLIVNPEKLASALVHNEIVGLWEESTCKSEEFH